MKPFPFIPESRQFYRGGEIDAAGRYVIYWMQMHRRLQYNFGLQLAASVAQELQKPLLIYEGLRPDYPFASDRFHAFILDGMAEHFAFFQNTGQLLYDPTEQSESEKAGWIRYLPFVPRTSDEARGFLKQLSQQAALVVSDEFPVFIVPDHNSALGQSIGKAFITVDSNGIVPLKETQSDPYSAYLFRKVLQKRFSRVYAEFPHNDPMKLLKKADSLQREDLALPKKFETYLQKSAELLTEIVALQKGSVSSGSRGSGPEQSARSRSKSGGSDSGTVPGHSTQRPGTWSKILNPFGLEFIGMLDIEGTRQAALDRAQGFVEQLSIYTEKRNDPDAEATSGLSPYLHFGKISIHEIVHRIFREYDLEDKWQALVYNNGSRGFFPGPPEVDAFLDEAITWRETGYHYCFHRKDYDQFSSLPDWARKTLNEHEADERPYVYSMKQLESASTHDEVWNAAQRELARTGKIHNYLRMLWGKKILEWSKTPRQGLETALTLNNKYSIDGRNPNSYSGVFWVFGRFDRPWQERPIFGKIRYMSSEQARKKIQMKQYLERFGPDGEQGRLL